MKLSYRFDCTFNGIEVPEYSRDFIGFTAKFLAVYRYRLFDILAEISQDTIHIDENSFIH